MAPKPRPLIDRFWEKVQKTDTCWLWIGGGVGYEPGYGKIWDRWHNVEAHRLSWEIHRGPIPAGMYVLHHCDNRACVNPDHLFVGTQLDNMRDKCGKKRQAKGEANGNRKLTEDQVLDILDWLCDGISPTVIARHFGLHVTTVHYIRSGRLWGYLGRAS